MSLRKNELELTINDISKHLVWEFAYGEGGIEMKMKPVLSPEPYDICQNRLLVRATYTLKNGVKKTGYMKPISFKPSFMGHLSPIDLNLVMFSHFGRIYFWFGSNKPKRRTINEFYKWLNLQPSEIFPIHVKSDVEIINGIDEGDIEGFLYCDENEVEDFFHMKAEESK